jgi:hypothetical protein
MKLIKWATGLLFTVAIPALATDLGKIRSQAPDDEFRSSVGLYDIERCMIDVDAIDTPTVYRQPDRPNFTMIAWSTAILIELENQNGVTVVKTHFQSPGGRKARKRLLACAGRDQA